MSFFSLAIAVQATGDAVLTQPDPSVFTDEPPLFPKIMKVSTKLFLLTAKSLHNRGELSF
jgi:hypothetical protein